RVSNPDVACPIHRDAGHPTVEPFRRIRTLLIQGWIAFFVEAELIPAHAPATSLRSDRVRGDDRLVAHDLAVYESLHDLVALHVEPAFGTGLRHAARQLAVTQVVIRRNTAPHGT